MLGVANCYSTQTQRLPAEVRRVTQMDVTDWDSNYGESTQMYVTEKNSNKNLLPYKTSEGGGEFECFSVHLSFYKLFPDTNVPKSV